MTIQELAEKLDDYSGTLSQEVEKLQMERTRGMLSSEEQLDLVGDLRAAVFEHLVRPWRAKAFWAVVMAILLLAAWWYLPPTIQYYETFKWGALALAVVAFLRAIFCFWMLLKLRKQEGSWLRKAEETVKKGGTLFDVN